MKSDGGSVRLILTIAAPVLILAGLVAAQNGGLQTTADAVLGQQDFVHNAPNAPDASAIAQPSRVAVDRSVSPNRVYLADTANSRVLGWNDVATLLNGQGADLVIGQPDFVTVSSGAGASSFRGPVGVAVDSNGNLYVADEGNSRVLEFNAPFAACMSFPCVGRAANLVFGQSGSFATGTCNLDNTTAVAASLCSPMGVATDAKGNVYIADTGNSRVLEYNSPLTKTAVVGSGDTIADSVFGQGAGGNLFSANQCNIGNSGASAISLCSPQDVAVDASGNVYIADTNNFRAVEYNEDASPPSNFSANTVFGQGGSFTTTGCNRESGGSGLCEDNAVTLDSEGNLYVSDFGNSRVVEYNTPLNMTSRPGSGDTLPDAVFGQADNLTSGQCNLDGSPDADTLCQPAGVAVDSAGDVFVSDQGNNRLLKYDTPLTTDTFADVVLGQPDFAQHCR
jgi:sugar lactone lactonase YvrE